MDLQKEMLWAARAAEQVVVGGLWGRHSQLEAAAGVLMRAPRGLAEEGGGPGTAHPPSPPRWVLKTGYLTQPSGSQVGGPLQNWVSP